MILLPPSSPNWTVNYDIGWIGFVHKRLQISDGFGVIVTGGIEYFTRWFLHNNEPIVSHVLGVTGPNMCIEANADGVEEDSLDQYFRDPKYTLYLRKPLQWTPDIGNRIVAKAREFVGYKYDDTLILADALNNSLLGHALNGLTHDAVAKWLVKFLDDPKQMICDEVWDLAMAAQPEYMGRGTLAQPAALNSPQALFSDEEIFAQSVTVIQGKA